jgi:hypothetical protein
LWAKHLRITAYIVIFVCSGALIPLTLFAVSTNAPWAWLLIFVLFAALAISIKVYWQSIIKKFNSREKRKLREFLRDTKDS